MNNVNANLGPQKESTSLIWVSVLGALCLIAGLTFRAGVALLPPGIFQETFLLGLSALFLSVAILTRRGQSLRRYWEIPFAFFIFTIAGAADTIFLHGFIDNVLHETSSTNNPLASTVLGTVLAQLVSTLSIVIPIILLTMASGNDLSSIFIVQYTRSLLPFLGITMILGLWLGYLMQRSGNIVAPGIFHAGSDIPIYLAFLSYTSA